MESGVVVCEAFPPLRENVFVGVGQSLDYDFKSGNLVLSGLASNLSAPAGRQIVHKVLRAGLGPDCGTFTDVGTFGGWLAFEPAVHASSLDVDAQKILLKIFILCRFRSAVEYNILCRFRRGDSGGTDVRAGQEAQGQAAQIAVWVHPRDIAFIGYLMRVVGYAGPCH